MTPVETLLREKIAQSGPITIAEYMELALAHPEHGYYMHRDPLGRDGDFVTSPEISQIFGELLGAWTAAYWQMSGGGDLAVVELGPGRGSLMRDFLRATKQVPGFHDSLVILMVETSPALARMQRAMLHEVHSRIGWARSIDQLPEARTVFLANEFFDALPIRQFVKTPDGLREKLVDIDGESGEIVFSLKEMGVRLVKGGRFSGDHEVVESSPLSRSIATRMAHHVVAHGGAGLIVDYGYLGGSRGNTLQAVKSHLFHPVLKDPGSADLTAHVDFDVLGKVFSEAGAQVYGPVDQGPFLRALGAEVRARALLERAETAQKEKIVSGLRRLTDKSEMGELFKVLGFCDDARIRLAGFERQP